MVRPITFMHSAQSATRTADWVVSYGIYSLL